MGRGQVAALDFALCRQVAGGAGFPRLRIDGRRMCWELARNGAFPVASAGCCCSAPMGTMAFSRVRPSAGKCRFSRSRQPRHGFQSSRQEAFYRVDPQKIAGLSSALRTFRDRHAWHADPHDRLARGAELDALAWSGMTFRLEIGPEIGNRFRKNPMLHVTSSPAI